MTNTTQDPDFTALSQLPNHISSFTTTLEDGTLIEATKDINQRHATTSYKLLYNVGLLLEKQGSSGGGKGISSQGDKSKLGPTGDMKKVTVMFQAYNYGFTLSNDKIYAIARSNE